MPQPQVALPTRRIAPAVRVRVCHAALMAAATSDLSTLCRACGFCCNGALFDNVPVSQGDAPPPERVRLRVLGERTSLVQPCAALGTAGCGIYAQRPNTCRTFVCMLGRALQEGEVSLPEAVNIVASARACADATSAALEAEPDAAGASTSESRALWRRVQNALAHERHAQLASTYVSHMRRVFLGRS